MITVKICLQNPIVVKLEEVDKLGLYEGKYGKFVEHDYLSVN